MATYLTLTNELLRRLNEVIMDATDFDTARNIQALAKDAINSSIREILHAAQEWPFTVTTYTQTLTAGVGQYAFPADLSNVDWDSFYLKKLTAIDNTPGKLKLLSYDEYLHRFRADEDTSGTGGYAAPFYVYQTQESKFGVTPLPDAAYEVEYKYWTFPSDLVLYTDTTIIPERFKNVIIDGAMMYMMMFRSNEQAALVYREKFDQGIRTMRRILMDDPINIRSSYIIKPLYFPRTVNG
jgi:hypothetical protein